MTAANPLIRGSELEFRIAAIALDLSDYVHNLTDVDSIDHPGRGLNCGARAHFETLAVWGMRWARSQLTEDELDVEFLMREIQRRLQTEHLPDGQTVICITFDELAAHKTWWLLAEGESVDLCTEDPGKDVDLYLSSSVRTLVEVWEGDLEIRTALRKKSITAHGMRHLIRTMPDWLGVCLYKDISRGDPELLSRLAE